MTTETEVVQYRPLTLLVHLQALLERGRISAGNQRRDLTDGTVAETYDYVTETLTALEDKTKAVMANEVRQHPAWPWMTKVKGIGPQTASLMLAYLLPPIPEKGPSSWYKAAGLYAIQVTGKDGEPESRMPRYSHLEKGQRATWHPRLRRNLYVVGTSLMRASGFYYEFYIQVKSALALKHPDWKGRSHAVAFWKMVKLFLAHLYEVWAQAEGIQTRGAYPMEILGHVKIEVPWEGG